METNHYFRPAVPRPSSNEMALIAHRGARKKKPENTLAAFEEAIRLGANMVELDVQKTKDGELVVFHDPIIDRMMNGTGNILDLTLEELRQYRTQDGGEIIPTLKEVYELCQGRVAVLTEIKAVDIGERLAQVIEETKMRSQVVVQSFIGEELKKFRQFDQKTLTALLMAEAWLDPRALIKALNDLKAQGVSRSYSTPFLNDIPKIHDEGYFVYLWGLNTDDPHPEIALAKAHGADGVIYPF